MSSHNQPFPGVEAEWVCSRGEAFRSCEIIVLSSAVDQKKKEKKRVPRFVLLNLFLFLLSSSSCLFTSDIVVVEDLVSMISSGGSCHCSDTTEIGNLDR